MHHRALLTLIACGLLVLPAPTRAVVLGGGTADRDCRVAFDGADAIAEASGVLCVDGAPCDADGVVDGVCTFDLRICVGVPLAGCQSTALDEIAVFGLPLVGPSLPAADGTCGPAGAVPVAIGASAGATLLARDGRDLRDVDYLNLCCVEAAGELDVARCAVLVDPAVSGCTTVPRKAMRAFERARERLDLAAAQPERARRHLKRAARFMKRARKAGRRLAKRDACGNALGLMGTYGRDVLRAATR